MEPIFYLGKNQYARNWWNHLITKKGGTITFVSKKGGTIIFNMQKKVEPSYPEKGGTIIFTEVKIIPKKTKGGTTMKVEP